MEPIKLITYNYETIKKVLDIIASMKPNDINESRKQVMAFDTLNTSFADIRNLEPEQNAPEPEPEEKDSYREISKEEDEQVPENFQNRPQVMLDEVEG